MRKIISLAHVTLDGIMQAPGGPEEDSRGGFPYGGWIMRFGDEAAGDALNEIMAGEFDLLLGRRTYEIFAAFWPYAGDDPIAKAFNRARKFVASRTLKKLDWAGSQLVDGDGVDGVRRLKAANGPELHIWGSGAFLQSLITADLVDEFRLWVYPVVLGTGKRLFESGLPARGLDLVDTRRGSRGVLFNTYRPASRLDAASAGIPNPSEAELARRQKLAAEEVEGLAAVSRRD